jgi:hypothetical protein
MYHHERRNYSFCLVLQTGPFLSVCKELLDDRPDTETFEWGEWGPEVTRCIPLSFVFPTGYRCTFGSYMLILGRPATWIDDFEDEGLFLMLLDFNPIPIRRGCEERNEEDYYLRIVQGDYGWYTSPDHLPEHTIYTGLPYRVFMRRWNPSCSNLHLDANTIVARLVRRLPIM